MLGRALTLLGLTEERCTFCGGGLDDPEQGYLCGECIKSIEPAHPILYEKLDFIESYRVFGSYDGVLAEAIRLIKFRSVKPLARRLGTAISRHLKEFIEETHPDLLTHVPLHTFRFWKRGFDHNEEILLGAGLNSEPVLFRKRHSRPLASYGREERLSAVKDAFGVREEFIDAVEGKRVLVFDDILTTGATSRAVSELLLSLGASEVFFYFLSREGVN